MKFKLSIIICFFLIYIQQIAAQPSVPTVNGLGYAKFVDIPISPFTGTFSYSVPIGSVSSGSLSLPISIDYHSGGNKVGEPSSNVGLGWNLNYGGTITRTVKGTPDDFNLDPPLNPFNQIGYWYSPTQNNTSPNSIEMALGNLDGEPDIFTWTAGGQSGKFYFDRDHNVVHITKTNAKIERIGTDNVFLNFIITLNDGTNYHFFHRNTQNPFHSNPINIEWLLAKVRSFDGKDSIMINYKNGTADDEIYELKSIGMPIKHGTTSSNMTIKNDADIFYIVRQKRLDQIVGTNNSIVFEYGTREDLTPYYSTTFQPLRISSIKYNNGTNCVEYLLNQSYFRTSLDDPNYQLKRLKLNSIQKRNCSNNTINEPPISFEYYGNTLSDGVTQHFPSSVDKNIDHFGYYNKNGNIENNTANCDMIQSTTVVANNGTVVTVGNANRTPSFFATEKSMLKKITLPTKGTIEYIYEQNDYHGNGSSTLLTPINWYKTCAQSGQSTSLFVTSDMKSNGSFHLWGVEDFNACGPITPRTATLSIYNAANQFLTSIQINNVSGTTNLYTNLSTISQISAGNTYIFSFSSVRCHAGLKFTYTNINPDAPTLAPGIRIAQVKISDGLNSANDIIKTYQYKKFSNSNQSSGFLVNTPKYGRAISGFTDVIFSAYSIKALQNIDGFGIGYENVTIDYNGIGKEKLVFHKEVQSITNEYPERPNQVLVGRQISSEKSDNNNVLVASSSINYNTEQHSLSDFFHQAFVLATTSLGIPSLVAHSSYQLKTKRFISVSSEVSTSDGVTTTTNHTYNTTATPAILGPVESSMTNSDGKVTKTYTRYTSQYDPSTTQAVTDVRNALIARNIIIPYEVRVEVDNINFLAGSRTEFSLFHPTTGTTTNVSASTGIPRPSKEMKYERTWDSSGALQAGSWTEQKSYKEYAFKGKLTKYNDFGYADNILEYDPASYNVTKSSFIDHHTQYEYFTNSTLLKKVIDIDGTSVSYEYDALIRMWKTIDNSKQITKTYSYYFGNGTSNDRHKTTVTTSFQGVNNSNSALTDMEDITYYDNLERTIQVVKKGQSPTNKDLVTSMEYDKYGRVIKEYLPVEGTGSTGAFLPIVTSWKHSLTTYESSPLSRKLSVLPPDWYATTYSYGSNTTANDGTITDPKSGSSFAQNTLYKTIITDPNGNKSISFSDRKGRIVLSAKYSGTSLGASTTSQKKIIQNVYDLKDRLEAVIVPGATWTTGADLNYYYRYDGEDKLIYKKLPSRGEIHYTYNSRDLIAGWRDNNVGTSKWFSTLYDAYGRTLKTGFSSTSSFSANNPNIISHYTQNTYGTTGIDKGKIKSAETQILGTQQYLTTNYVYDPTTGRLQSTSGNHHLNIGNVTDALTSSYVYDKGGNVTNTNTGIIAASGQANLPVNYIDKYDHVGRNTENIFQYNNGTETTLSKQIYNHREELITKYQGKTGLTGVNEYLQEMNFSYLTNGLLKSINQGYHTTNANDPNITSYTSCSNPNPNNYSTYNDKDLFYLELYYDAIIPGGVTQFSRKNGEISAVRWQTKGRSYQNYLFNYDFLGQLKTANYRDFNHATNTMVNTGTFSEIVDYDERGNITTLKRVGATSSALCSTNLTFDDLNFNYSGQTGNRVSSILDNVAWAAGQNGFKPVSGSTFSYDANGNITADPYKGITSIEYNVFDKPTKIIKSDNQYITFTYDGSGNMLTKSIFNASNVLLEKRDYIGNFEYVGGVLESVMHSEGRFRSATAKHEYHFKDHLGNTRLVYCDTDNNGWITVNNEILQESHYYPFGLEFRGQYLQQSGYDYRYKFNDIERLKDLDVGIDMAFYRGMDPTTGRWMQVDPKAEIDFGGSPYRHAFNNPISFTDTDGDLPLHIGAGIVGAVVNTYNNWDKIVKNPWSAVGYIATGVVAGVVSLSPGGPALAAKIAAGGNFVTDVAGGNLPEFRGIGDVAGYGFNLAMNAIDVGGAGKLAKAGMKGLKSLGIDFAKESADALVDEGLSITSGNYDVLGFGAEIDIDQFNARSSGMVHISAPRINVYKEALPHLGASLMNNTVGGLGIHGNSTPSLPDKTIVNQGGVKIEHYYKSGDHGHAHAHVKGGGPETKIGPNGHPMKGSPSMTTKQQSVYDSNRKTVRKTLNKIGKYLKYIGK